jgi:hypothetical protein
LFFQKFLSALAEFQIVAAKTARRGHHFGVEKRRKISLFFIHYICLLFNLIFIKENKNKLKGNTKSFGSS